MRRLAAGSGFGSAAYGTGPSLQNTITRSVAPAALVSAAPAAPFLTTAPTPQLPPTAFFNASTSWTTARGYRAPAGTSTTRTFDLTPLPPPLRSQWDHAGNVCKKFTIIEPTSTRIARWRCTTCDGEFRRRVDSHVRRGGDCPHCAKKAARGAASSSSSANAALPSEDEAMAYLKAMLSATSTSQARRSFAASVQTAAESNLAIRMMSELRELCRERDAKAHDLSPSAGRIQLQQHAVTFHRFLQDLIAGRSTTAQKKASQHLPQPPTSATPSRDLLDRAAYAPMLAYSWDKYQHLVAPNTPLFVSRKLDGVRAVAVWDPLRQEPVFLSRLGNPFESADRVADAIRPLFLQDPKLVLDGELYIHRDANAKRQQPLDFGSLVGAIKSTRALRTPAHVKIQKRLQYHVFDAMHGTGIKTNVTPFSTRLAKIERALATLSPSALNIVHLLEQNVMTRDQIPAELAQAIDEEGYEGLIVRVGDLPYEHGRRSMNMLKVKTMHDAEFKITGVVEGKGRLQGMVGAIECVTEDGKPFKAMFGVDDAERRYWWLRRRQLTGKHATVRFQEMTLAGVPRFGQFKCVRSDASGRGFV
jgi:DNA ligase-1